MAATSDASGSAQRKVPAIRCSGVASGFVSASILGGRLDVFALAGSAIESLQLFVEFCIVGVGRRGNSGRGGRSRVIFASLFPAPNDGEHEPEAAERDDDGYDVDGSQRALVGRNAERRRPVFARVIGHDDLWGRSRPEPRTDLAPRRIGGAAGAGGKRQPRAIAALAEQLAEEGVLDRIVD